MHHKTQVALDLDYDFYFQTQAKMLWLITQLMLVEKSTKYSITVIVIW